MLSRRLLLKGLGWSGAAAAGLGSLNVACQRTREGEQAREAGQTWDFWKKTGMWTAPEAGRVVEDFPGRGVSKLWIPYRERRGKIQFPNNARLTALIFVSLDYAFSPESRPNALFKLNFWNLSEGSEYNFSIGGWRALEALEEIGVKSTVLASGFGMLKYPAIHKEFHRHGHEIAAHGWESTKPAVMYTPQQEAECIQATTEVISSATGDRPVGWITPRLQCTERTYELLADAGYLWHGDLRDDDIPYGLKVRDKVLVEIPFRTMTTDDYGIWGPERALAGLSGVAEQVGGSRIGFDAVTAVEYYKDVVDAYLETVKSSWPMLLVFGIHPGASCIPDRIAAVVEILRYLKSHPDIQIMQYRELANYWKAQYL